jgi:hypothetical protein
MLQKRLHVAEKLIDQRDLSSLERLQLVLEVRDRIHSLTVEISKRIAKSRLRLADACRLRCRQSCEWRLREYRDPGLNRTPESAAQRYPVLQNLKTQANLIAVFHGQILSFPTSPGSQLRRQDPNPRMDKCKDCLPIKFGREGAPMRDSPIVRRTSYISAY